MCGVCVSVVVLTMVTRSLESRPQGQNAPSGIAQLRKSSGYAPQSDNIDHMNLDDFIVPSSIGTPAGISPAPSSIPEDLPSSAATAMSSIPIKQQRRLQEEELQPARASAPSNPPSKKDRTGGEFNYVPRHVRKTSVDERRVSGLHGVADDIHTDCHSLRSDVPKPLLKYLPSATAPSFSKTRRKKPPSRITPSISLPPPCHTHRTHKACPYPSTWTPSTSTTIPSSTLPDRCSNNSPSLRSDLR